MIHAPQLWQSALRMHAAKSYLVPAMSLIEWSCMVHGRLGQVDTKRVAANLLRTYVH